MKLTVLVPSEDYRSSAGARIRYGGLGHGLAAAEVALRLESIASFDPATTDCDALLISKCHDARSIMAAAIMSRRGKLVGVDLFDDYFSQTTDSRLTRYREWLTDLLEECHFCLCSTEAMANAVRRYQPELSIHVVNDPARDHTALEVCRLADAKWNEAQRDNTIRTTWFGVGDNPYFQVGLTDLYAHSAALSELSRTGMAVELTILTNRRALRPEGLELISRLPVPCNVREWSEDVEREVLEKSLVAFLPVGSEAFSAAKSLNRAWTALSYGCQVLSVGHPLYTALEPLIYRDSAALLSDLSMGPLRLSSENVAVLQEKRTAVGSAETEALRLAEFLQCLVPAAPSDSPRICVVHGLSTRGEVHNLAHSIGALSVASPYCTAKLSFDVLFSGFPPEMKMIKGSAKSAELTPRSVAGPPVPVSYQLATYAHAMDEIRRQLDRTFGPVRMIVSETSRVPLSTWTKA
jgi:hypothetical protein